MDNLILDLIAERFPLIFLEDVKKHKNNENLRTLLTLWVDAEPFEKEIFMEEIVDMIMTLRHR